MTTLHCSVKGAIRREFYSKTTTDERRAYLADHWDADDITEVMDVISTRKIGRYTYKEFFFSDGTRGAVRA